MELSRRRAGKPHRRVSRVVAFVVPLLVFGPGMVQWGWLSWRSYRLGRAAQRLQASHDQLTREQQRLTNDPVYLEGLIRSLFKLARPGELVVPLDSSTSQRSRSAL